MFVDYYETLEISPNANSETIERIFRYFAMRYHPDNRETGNESRFSEIVEAHNTLRDPVKRAQYDILYREHLGLRHELTDGARDGGGIERDAAIQANLLSLLYVRRRRDVNNAGIGDDELERLSGCPREHLEFHLWYLKAKGFIGRTENGTFAITVEGIDHAGGIHGRDRPDATRLIDHAGGFGCADLRDAADDPAGDRRMNDDGALRIVGALDAERGEKPVDFAGKIGIGGMRLRC